MSTTILQPTATERFSKSIGGSLRSVMNAGSRTYFMLEHKTNTAKHQVGESAQYIGDYVELGRGNKYAVNFGDDAPTVSRPHAAIIRKDNGWVLKPLSKTNPTLLNGRRIEDETRLNNGDEIQLSLNGPRLSFLTPTNNKVGTMGMTIRMKAFMNEAVRPYRTALTTITLLFLVIIGGLVYYGKNRNEYYAKLFKDQTAINQQMADSIRSMNADNKKLQQHIADLSKKMPIVNRVPPSNDGGDPGSTPSPAGIKSLYPGVYYILTDKIVFTNGNETKEVDYRIIGTGFLLKDGRFVTARHVARPWLFTGMSGNEESDKTEMLLNLIANNGGKVVEYMTAYSPDGSKFSLTSEDFTMDNSQDAKSSKTDEEGNTYVFSQASLKGGSDWAYAATNKQGMLDIDGPASTSLEAATPLYVLGYSFGIGANGANDIKPVYSDCKVSREGLDQGTIDISGRGFDQGNSGGPVFIEANSKYTVVGIVSGEHGNQGIFTPIAAIR
jgi:cell division protein FtsB